MKTQKLTTKARDLETTKKSLCFYTTPSSFVLSSPAELAAGKFRVFVIRGSSVFCLLISFLFAFTDDCLLLTVL